MEGDLVKASIIPMRSQNFTCLRDPADNVLLKIEEAFSQCATRQEELGTQGSGWSIKSVRSILVEFIEFRSLNGGGGGTTASATYSKNPYGKTIDMSDIKGKRHLLNIESQLSADKYLQNKCLLYVTAAFFLAGKLPFRRRTNPREYEDFIKDDICTEGLRFPSGLSDIVRLVAANPSLSLKVNVLVMLSNGIFPLHTDIGDGENVMNILLLRTKSEDDLKAGSGHYVLITDIQAFLRERYGHLVEAGITAAQKPLSYRKGKFCIKCFSHFTTGIVLREHAAICRNKTSQCEVLPDADGNHFIEFENHHKKLRLPVAVYFDFEAFLEPASAEEREGSEKTIAAKRRKTEKRRKECASCTRTRCRCDTTSYTKIEQLHKCMMYAYAVVDSEGTVLAERVRYCADGSAAEKFVDDLLRLEGWFDDILDDEAPMLSMTTSEERRYKATQTCHICTKRIEVDQVKCRDHDHYTQKFRGEKHFHTFTAPRHSR